MLGNVTIDSVLKYYYAIDSDKLSENKIDIDESLEIENSFSRYLQLFASFLNEAYYRGYVISESIIKKLMDIIEYEGYEYQIIEKYINILISYMDDYHCDDDNRPAYREIILSSEDSQKFINEYLVSVQKIQINLDTFNPEYFLTNVQLIENGAPIPHFRNPESTSDEKEFRLKVLIEIEYPIDFMFRRVNNNDLNIDAMYIIYKNNLPAYKALLEKFKMPEFMVFLLDENDNASLDILINNTRSVRQLATIINTVYRFNVASTENIFNDTMIRNVNRLFNLTTINLVDKQLYKEIRLDLGLWKNYLNNNANSTLISDNLKESVSNAENDEYIMQSSLDLIYKIPNESKYKDDAYFYARQAMINMNYDILCDNLVTIYKDLKDYIDHDKFIDLFDECIIGLSYLKNPNVNDALKKLAIDLEEETSLDFKDHLIDLINKNIIEEKSTN